MSRCASLGQCEAAVRVRRDLECSGQALAGTLEELRGQSRPAIPAALLLKRGTRAFVDWDFT